MSSSDELTETQISALLDILSHHEVYSEIRDFRVPKTLSQYGPPFDFEPGKKSTSPSLQSLVSDFLLNLPGLKEVSDGFWRTQVAAIIENFEEAELSESYDKGTIGIRRTVATAASAILEYPVRGIFNGSAEPDSKNASREYNLQDADDLQAGFTEMLRQVVYGTLVDDLVKTIGETDKLSDHSSMVQAAHEFGLVNLASFLHYALILSPKGQHILTLVDLANKLVPYSIIKQTLKIGNVASMINAMVKVVLAKVSVGSVTNWMGLTSAADEGHNLMQSIISTVLAWDVRDMKSKASKIEKDKTGPSKEQLGALKAYVTKTREEHAAIRQQSQQDHAPIVSVILTKASLSNELSEEQHKMAQDYLATHLSVRDREQIVRVLCDANPDHLTQSVRDLVASYEPVIRGVHNAVDLSDTLADFERFLRDLIKLAKLSDQQSRGRNLFSKSAPILPPTVGDFVELFHKHQYSLHKFLHQCVKNGDELTGWFHEYALQTASRFRHKTGDASGDLSVSLKELFAALPSATRSKLIPLLDTHTTYISNLHTASFARLRSVVASPPSYHPVLAKDKDRSRSRSLMGSAINSRSGSPAAASGRSGGNSTPSAAPTSNPAPPPPSSSSTSAATAVISPQSNTDPGPGAYLARWKHLLDSVALTPGPKGPTLPLANVKTDKSSHSKLSRSSSSSSIPSLASNHSHGDSKNSTADVQPPKPFEKREHELHMQEEAFEDAREHVEQLGLNEDNPRPDVSPVVHALGKQFRELLASRSCHW